MNDDFEFEFDNDFETEDLELNVEPYLETIMEVFSKMCDKTNDENEFFSLILSVFLMKQIVVEKVLKPNHSKEEAKELITTFNKMAKELFNDEENAPIDRSKLN